MSSPMRSFLRRDAALRLETRSRFLGARQPHSQLFSPAPEADEPDRRSLDTELTRMTAVPLSHLRGF